MLQGRSSSVSRTAAWFLAPEDGKFAKASGKLEVAIEDVSMFDGKSKLFGVALPPAQIGRITLAAKCDKGQMTLEDLGAHGGDLELAGEGKVRINESYKRSLPDVFLKFKFADSYPRTRTTPRAACSANRARSTGRPSSSTPKRPFIRAKTEDDF